MTMDPVAEGGFVAASSTTARIRSAYARTAIGRVKESCPRGGHVVDLDAGTGILAGLLARAGLRVTAVEALGSMASHLRRALPSVPVVLATADALPLARHAADVVTIGHTIHRCTSAVSVLDEAARVLRPGGVLVTLWNERDGSVRWADELTELVRARTGGHPVTARGGGDWAEAAASTGHFADVRTETFANPSAATLADVLDRVRSIAAAAALEAHEREALIAEAAALLAAHDELTGTFDDPHRTVVDLYPVIESP